MEKSTVVGHRKASGVDFRVDIILFDGHNYTPDIVCSSNLLCGLLAGF